MKTYLEDLKNALLKMQLSEDKINEILSDMEEMIASAKEEGISDDDIKLKFGNPEKLARELAEIEPKVSQPVDETDQDTTYVFEPTSEKLSVLTKFFSDDVTYRQVDSDKIRVVLKNKKDSQKYHVSYQDNVLKIEPEHKVQTFFGFSFGHSSHEIYVEIPKGTKIDEFKHQVVNGDTVVEGLFIDKLNLNTTEGDLNIDSINVNDCSIHTVNGDIKFLNSHAKIMHISTVSGDIEAFGTVVESDLTINTVSGDFEAKECDAHTFYFHAVSGDASGREFYIKRLSFDSISGDCSIKNDRKEHIEIIRQKTLSGDIHIS